MATETKSKKAQRARKKPQKNSSKTRATKEKLGANQYTDTVRDWDGVDWSMSDVDISRLLDCSRERARQKRKALKMPKVARRIASRSAEAKFTAALEEISNKSRIDAARTIGIAPSTFDKYRRMFKLNVRDGRYKLTHRLWNFDLPNADLERIWQLKRNSAANTRSRLHKGPPRWNIQRGSVPEDKAYFKAIAAEENKAKKHSNKSNPTPQEAALN